MTAEAVTRRGQYSQGFRLNDIRFSARLVPNLQSACMEKMFVSLENSSNGSAHSAFATPETMRSKVTIASYRCKLYRAQLDQGNARRNIAPQLQLRLATARKTMS